MRNQATTNFWKNALESLPPQIRARYALQFQAAERRELSLDALIEAGVCARHALKKLSLKLGLYTPRSASAER